MKRIVLAKNATWGLAFLVGAGAFVFALAFVVYPPRRPGPLRVPESRVHVQRGGELDMSRISKIWTNDFNIKPPPPKHASPFEGAALAGTMTGPAGSTAAITTKDGSQILVSEKDGRVTHIAPGAVTLDDGASLNISRGERR